MLKLLWEPLVTIPVIRLPQKHHVGLHFPDIRQFPVQTANLYITESPVKCSVKDVTRHNIHNKFHNN